MSTETVTVEAAAPPVETNEQKALKLTRRYSLWSMGGGLIPIAGLDLVAIVAAQIKMVHDMSEIYGVEFKENRAKSIVTSLIGSLGIVPLGTGVFFSALKFVPFVGALAATISLPIIAGGITYATGKVFILHFESGGTFLDFNADKMKRAYRVMFDEGKAAMAKDASAASVPATETGK